MEFLHQLGIKPNNNGTSTGIQSWSEDRVLESYSPVNGELIAKISVTSYEQYLLLRQKAQEAFEIWKMWPAP